MNPVDFILAAFYIDNSARRSSDRVRTYRPLVSTPESEAIAAAVNARIRVG